MSTHGATLTVLYPRENPSSQPLKFDMSYYLKTHLPICEEAWAGHGLQSWEVGEFKEGPYAVQAIARFGDMGEMIKALTAGAPKTQSDVKNYTDSVPVVLMSEVQGVNTGELK